MFTHLLVPLDGSRLSESVLPTAARLAQTLKASVALIHIIEKNPHQEAHNDRHLTQPEEALAYLDYIAASSFPSGIKIDSHVHTSPTRDLAQGIVDHAGEFDSDLVVMCTHGKSGLRNFVFGSTAQQVLASRRLPVLLIPPRNDRPDFVLNFGRFLVPLDGDPEHEQVLCLATDLAKSTGAGLDCMVVVHTQGSLPGKRAASGLLLPGTTREILEMTVQAARDYLDERLKGITAQGIPTSSNVCRGEPASVIVDEALRTNADLIILGTHGKTGLDAFWSGSVASRVVSGSRLPMLAVPISAT